MLMVAAHNLRTLARVGVRKNLKILIVFWVYSTNRPLIERLKYTLSIKSSTMRKIEKMEWMMIWYALFCLLLLVSFLINWLPGMIVGLALSISLPMFMGVSSAYRDEFFKKKFKPALIFFCSLNACFFIIIPLIIHYWEVFYGKKPDFLLGGMHPGFALLFPILWLATFFVSTLFFVVFFDKFVLKEEIEQFMKRSEKE